MSFPIRCFSCGKVIKWDPYAKLLETIGPDKALDLLGMRRSCCRRMFKSHNPQIMEDMLKYTAHIGGDPKVFLDDPDE